MVSFEEIQTVYYMVAATGVLVAAIFYVLNLRVQQTNMKQTLETRRLEIILRHAQMNITPTLLNAWTDVYFNQKFKSFEEYMEKYRGSVNPTAFANLSLIIQYFENFGGLLRDKMVSLDLIERVWHPVHIFAIWERFEPVLKWWREYYHADSLYSNFEYLVDQLTKQRPESTLTRSICRAYVRGEPIPQK